MSQSGFNGRKLKAIRERKAWSAEEVAHELNLRMRYDDDRITVRSIARWENEGVTPRNPEIIQSLAAIFDCETEDFFDPIGEPGVAQSVMEDAIDFNDIIAEKTEDFVGREALFKKVDSFLAHRPGGYYLIKGDPGIGKSAIAASLVKKYGCIHHFNVRTLGIDRADQFIRNVCAQLISRHQLGYKDLPGDIAEDGRFLKKTLSDASKTARPPHKILIVIDALDEVNTDTLPSGHNLLYLPISLPPHIYVIATTRHDHLPLRFDYECTTIDHNSTWNTADIERYLHLKMDAATRKYVRKQRLTEAKFVSAMAQKSDGNFMYVKYVLREIATGFYKDMTFDELPIGLANYYEDHWRNMGMMASPLPREKIKIIYVLSEAGKALSPALLAKFSKEDKITVQGVLDEWTQFLHTAKIGEDLFYAFYHNSFRDFLLRKHIVQAAEIDIKNINQGIADSFFDD